MAGILSGPIDAPPEDRLATVYPRVDAVAGMAVVHRASGFSGVLVRVEGAGPVGGRRAGSVSVGDRRTPYADRAVRVSDGETHE